MLHKPWVLLTSAFFHGESATFAILRNTDIDQKFFESSKIVLIKMVVILMMPAKLAI